MKQPNILLCTVGTSLFQPNLAGLEAALGAGTIPADLRPAAEELARAYTARDWPEVIRGLGSLPDTSRLCGAEINSIASLVATGRVPADCGLFFFHSATDQGRDIATILTGYYRDQGHSPVKAVEVADLQDADPKRSRTHGLRNLARLLCKVIRDYSPAACALNATGGYKAQIAIAVLLGQALGVSVYYKHELFPEIIAFPPMPVALDFEVWMRGSGMLYALEGAAEPVPAARFQDEWDEKYESLVERVTIDGEDFLDLSATGQIFHETFRERFRTARDQVLPPPAPPGLKKEPVLKSNEGHMLAHRDEIKRFLVRLTQEVPQVVLCMTSYFNPDLPEPTRFRAKSEGIEGIYTSGTYCVKFRVETTAQTEGQRAAVVAALNEWLAHRG